VRRVLEGGIELDDDPGRVDVGAVHAFLAGESYWARGRSLATVEGSIAGAARVLGLYDAGRQIGFARAISDGATVAYLADVYVLPAYRRRGLGLELVRAMVDEGPLAGCRWLLHTADAHGLYDRFGFEPPPTTGRIMERGPDRRRF
jgi:GNAT superfamily N-acetyltransferase